MSGDSSSRRSTAPSKKPSDRGGRPQLISLSINNAKKSWKNTYNWNAALLSFKTHFGDRLTRLRRKSDTLLPRRQPSQRGADRRRRRPALGQRFFAQLDTRLLALVETIELGFTAPSVQSAQMVKRAAGGDA